MCWSVFLRRTQRTVLGAAITPSVEAAATQGSGRDPLGKDSLPFINLPLINLMNQIISKTCSAECMYVCVRT